MVGVERLLVVHTPLPWPEQADVAWVRVALPPEIVRQVVTPPRPEPHDLTVLATGRLSDARATDRFDCSLAPRELLVTPGRDAHAARRRRVSAVVRAGKSSGAAPAGSLHAGT